jgi:hypothetical protein
MLLKYSYSCQNINLKVKAKENFTLVQATKAQKGSSGTALLFL